MLSRLTAVIDSCSELSSYKIVQENIKLHLIKLWGIRGIFTILNLHKNYRPNDLWGVDIIIWLKLFADLGDW